MQTTITKEEQKAIASLERLAKKWPKTLKLFSHSGSLVVEKLDPNICLPIRVASIVGIKNDGGDPNWHDEFHDDQDIQINYE